MTEWVFWGDRQIVSVYGNIYLRTFVEDWFKIVDTIAKQIKGKKLLDLGCGEGHTTKQILDRLKQKYVCDLVEPNGPALNSAKKFLSFENNIGESFAYTLDSFKANKKYDSVRRCNRYVGIRGIRQSMAGIRFECINIRKNCVGEHNLYCTELSYTKLTVVFCGAVGAW